MAQPTGKGSGLEFDQSCGLILQLPPQRTILFPLLDTCSGHLTLYTQCIICYCTEILYMSFQEMNFTGTRIKWVPYFCHLCDNTLALESFFAQGPSSGLPTVAHYSATISKAGLVGRLVSLVELVGMEPHRSITAFKI